MTDEVAWVRAAQSGDHRAFANLVELFQRPVYSLAYRFLGDADDVDDAAQEAFVKAFRALDSYDVARPFSTWILSITAHHCIDRLRRQRLNSVSLDGIPAWREPASPADDPERLAVRAAEADDIQNLLQAIPDDHRLVIILRYWHDLGYAEIAAVLGDTESAVKSRLHRARRQLADLIGRREEPPPPQSSHRRDLGAGPAPQVPSRSAGLVSPLAGRPLAGVGAGRDVTASPGEARPSQWSTLLRRDKGETLCRVLTPAG